MKLVSSRQETWMACWVVKGVKVGKGKEREVEIEITKDEGGDLQSNEIDAMGTGGSCTTYLLGDGVADTQLYSATKLCLRDCRFWEGHLTCFGAKTSVPCLDAVFLRPVQQGKESPN